MDLSIMQLIPFLPAVAIPKARQINDLPVPVLSLYRYAHRYILFLSRFSQSEHNRISVVPFGTIIKANSFYRSS